MFLEEIHLYCKWMERDSHYHTIKLTMSNLSIYLSMTFTLLIHTHTYIYICTEEQRQAPRPDSRGRDSGAVQTTGGCACYVCMRVCTYCTSITLTIPACLPIYTHTPTHPHIYVYTHPPHTHIYIPTHTHMTCRRRWSIRSTSWLAVSLLCC